MKPFTPRHKKFVKPTFKTKIVRIDSHTQIEVRDSISDADAREHYLNATRDKQHHPRILQPPLVDGDSEVMPLGSQEALAAIIDDADLPEDE